MMTSSRLDLPNSCRLDRCHSSQEKFETMKRLVLTGAAGRLGSYLREPLTTMCEELISTDVVDGIGNLYPGERYAKGDLAKLDDMLRILEDAEMVVHLGAYADEGPFEKLVGPNIVGAYNVWEAAYLNGLRRVIFSSSIHAVGMHSKTSFIGTDASHRPDSFYGLTKCFAEDLGSLYWDKRGLESVHMRILSSDADPAADNQAPSVMCHGGPFAMIELGESAVAVMDIVDDRKRT